MPTYGIVDVDVTGQVRYDKYRQLSGASVAAYHGRFIMQGGAVEVLEGTWLPKQGEEEIWLVEKTTCTQSLYIWQKA